MTFDGRRLSMEDDLQWKTTFDGRQPLMEADNEDDLKNKADLHIAGRHTALDISRFAEFFLYFIFRVSLNQKGNIVYGHG